MIFYLSSFKIGNKSDRLKSLLTNKSKAVYISNALDCAPEVKKRHQEWDLNELKEIGISASPLDLRNYFGKKADLKKRMEEINFIYISGGNVFDLRMAMKLSGFDKMLRNFIDTNKIYAGYSAAVCVLSPTLKGYHIVDDPKLNTYGNKETIWEGLDLIDWQFAPHFDSDHSESEDINKEIKYYQKHDMKYKKLKDGEVLIREINSLSRFTK